MTRLRCVTMQRDETGQLEAWLGYHGYLVGFENLTVFDNGSTNRETIEILRRFARVGTRVIWEHREDADFAARDTHFDNLTRQWDGNGATCGLRLECDERLALFSTHGLSCSRAEIEAYLAAPFAAAESFTVDLGLQACSEHPGFFRAEPVARRLAVRGSAGEGGTRRLEDLTVIATRAAGPALRAGSVLVGVPSLGSLGAALDLPGVWDGPDVGGELALRFPGRRGKKRSASFDGVRYLTANPDVAAAGWPPLKHFLMRGVLEDRALG